MATYRYVGYDLMTSFKKVFDDADIRLNQVLYWIQVISNRIRYQQSQVTESGLYTSTFSSVAVIKDTKGRVYFDLPNQIMDLPNEKGIEYITYNEDTGCCCEGAAFMQVLFQPTNVMKAHRLYGDEYEKPTPSNPYFYRVGHKVDSKQVSRIYLVGVDCIDITDVEIGIKCTLDPSNVCDLDDEIPVPNEQIEFLMKEVLALGRFVMMIPEEMENDGADKASEVQARPIVPAPAARQQAQRQTQQ